MFRTTQRTCSNGKRNFDKLNQNFYYLYFLLLKGKTSSLIEPDIQHVRSNIPYQHQLMEHVIVMMDPTMSELVRIPEHVSQRKPQF